MAEVIACNFETVGVKPKLKVFFFIVAAGVLASIIQVYLQFLLKQIQNSAMPILAGVSDEWFIDLAPCVLFWCCGLSCFYIFYRFCRPLNRVLPPNIIAALLTVSYGYCADYWISSWHFGFDHSQHIVSNVFPYFMTVARIYPISLGIMFCLSLLMAKRLSNSQPSSSKNYFQFLKRDWLTLSCLVLVSSLIWIGQTGTVGVFPYTGPSSNRPDLRRGLPFSS
jgi:hypothetical protein